MKQILIRLYPHTWRHRYEEEFLELLELQPLTIWLLADILMGALDAHWYTAAQSIRRNAMANWIYRREQQIVLLLWIGVLLVLRSIIHSVFLVFNIDILAIIGVGLLCSGFILAYYIRCKKAI